MILKDKYFPVLDQSNKSWVKLINIRSVDKNGNVYATKIKDCKSVGIKPTYRILSGVNHEKNNKMEKSTPRGRTFNW